MPKPVVYYDGVCPVCAREIGFYRRHPGADALAWEDVSTAGPQIAPGLTRGAALARLHARREDGTLVSGAAAFALIWSRLPGFRWAGTMLSLPPILWGAELGYRAFLRLRPLWRRAETRA